MKISLLSSSLLGSSRAFSRGAVPFQWKALGVLILTCLAGGSLYPSTPSVALSFYVVHAKAAEGLHHFDSVQYPNLGYIGERPDLVVARLESVKIVTYRDRSRIEGQEAGENNGEDKPALVIELTNDDTNALSVVTGAHLGKRLLLTLRDQVLWAPYIHMKIDTTSIQIVPPMGTDLEKVKRELESLVQKK